MTLESDLDLMKRFSVSNGVYLKFSAFSQKIDQSMRSYIDQYKPDKKLIDMLKSAESRDINDLYFETGTSMYIRDNCSLGTLYRTYMIYRTLARSKAYSERFLKQIKWRHFYMQAFYLERKDKESNSWPGKVMKEAWLTGSEAQRRHRAFTHGKTGYEIIDAAIMCLKATGYMHNRLRMLCGLFYCKNLYLDWRHGARFFSKYLLDYDKPINDGNWIWCSQLMFDSQQFVRFMSPDLEYKRCKRSFIKEWCHPNRVSRIVDWQVSCEAYRKAKKDYLRRASSAALT